MRLSFPLLRRGAVASNGPPTGEPGTRLTLLLLKLSKCSVKSNLSHGGSDTYKYAGRMFPPGSPPSWSFTEITSVKLYKNPPELTTEFARVVRVTVASTVPSSVGPELSCISWKKIMSGCNRKSTTSLATLGSEGEVGARLSTLKLPMTNVQASFDGLSVDAGILVLGVVRTVGAVVGMI